MCALREVFEETGILIIRRGHFSHDEGLSSAQIGGKELASVQQHVSANPIAFLAFCQRRNFCPIIGSLKEWSNWLSPTYFPSHQRYDTIFYIGFLENRPNISAQQNGETDHVVVRN